MGSADSPLEQAADRIAHQIMRTPAPAPVPGLRTRPGTAHHGPAPSAPGIVGQVLAAPGRPLDPGDRGFFEPRFGHDFSAVRIHDDARAAESALSVGALAYTLGSHIVFGSGRHTPGTTDGRHLLAHELTHVVQQHGDPRPVLRRQAFDCASLITAAGASSLLSGREVHGIIARDFSVVPGARSVGIPGASAGPQRTDALCGGYSKVISPQVISKAGFGYPDLARQSRAGVLSVAEIKPAALPCLVDGEEQVMRYIDQGNGPDPAQVAWRGMEGVKVVSPMLPRVYPDKVIPTPRALIRTGWCLPGLLAYVVLPRGRRVWQEQTGREVSRAERDRGRERLTQEAARVGIEVPAAVAAAAILTAGEAVVKRALWRHFWRAVIERFAFRAAVAVALAAADGPLPFGELIDVGISAVTAVEIVMQWDDLWHKAELIAASEAPAPALEP